MSDNFWHRRKFLDNGVMGLGFAATIRSLQSEQLPLFYSSTNQPKYKQRAKRVIFLFMKGGPSQVDTFDYKPRLQRDHGQPLPFAKPKVQFAKTGNLLASPWDFQRYGECGHMSVIFFPKLQSMSTICVSFTRCMVPTLHTGLLFSNCTLEVIISYVLAWEHGYLMVWERKMRICHLS